MGALVIRTASLALAIIPGHFAGVSPDTYQWVTYSFGFSHYVLALVYAQRQVAAVARDPAWPLMVLGLGALGFGIYEAGFPLLAYFGLHHALNEAWTPRSAGRMETAPSRVFEFALHALAYAIALRREIGLAGVPLGLAVVTLSGCVAYCGVRVLRGDAGGLRNAVNVAAPSIGSMALVAASLFIHVGFLEIVLYHFLLWAMLPVVRFRHVPGHSVKAYLTLLFVTTAASIALSPLGPSLLRIPMLDFFDAFLVGSYLHITVSFALSDSHPAWIVRLFRPPNRHRATA